MHFLFLFGSVGQQFSRKLCSSANYFSISFLMQQEINEDQLVTDCRRTMLAWIHQHEALVFVFTHISHMGKAYILIRVLMGIHDALAGLRN